MPGRAQWAPTPMPQRTGPHSAAPTRTRTPGSGMQHTPEGTKSGRTLLRVGERGGGGGHTGPAADSLAGAHRQRTTDLRPYTQRTGRHARTAKGKLAGAPSATHRSAFNGRSTHRQSSRRASRTGEVPPDRLGLHRGPIRGVARGAGRTARRGGRRHNRHSAPLTTGPVAAGTGPCAGGRSAFPITALTQHGWRGGPVGGCRSATGSGSTRSRQQSRPRRLPPQARRARLSQVAMVPSPLGTCATYTRTSSGCGCGCCCGGGCGGMRMEWSGTRVASAAVTAQSASHAGGGAAAAAARTVSSVTRSEARWAERRVTDDMAGHGATSQHSLPSNQRTVPHVQPLVPIPDSPPHPPRPLAVDPCLCSGHHHHIPPTPAPPGG